MRHWNMVWMALLLVAGCAGNSGTTVTLDAGDDGHTADVVAELSGQPDGGTVDLVGDDEFAPDVLAFDVDMVDATGPLCEAGEGCFLDPCNEGDDCISGWCVGHMGESVCTQQCQSECPPGWACQQVPGTAPDVVFICVSGHANLCLPCATGADCKDVAGSNNVCVDYGDQGSFCGGTCTMDEDCPWGFSCEDTTTVDGIATSQCVADAGVCPCTKKSVALALWTPCEVVNEFGTCQGQRICTGEGLTDCDAPAAAAEMCNGIDDDCDGDVDEPELVEGKLTELCDDLNPCTEDACKGEAGCSHTALSGIECVDGNPCTVADHCDNGECVGTTVDCDDDNPCTDDACDETGGCVYVDNAVDCDDGDPCTVADECSQGQCGGTAIACDCLVDADCEALEDGDLCNGTLVCDTSKMPFQCRVDIATVVSCADPEGLDAPCLEAWCDPATGDCSMIADNEGGACTDGDACSMGDTCTEGTCLPGIDANCADDNPCTDDACDAQLGCTHTANQAPCQDGDACTINDYCSQGTCVGGAQALCNDNNVCTEDACDEVTGCVFEPVSGPCDDQNACTTSETCTNGWCGGGSAIDCDDASPCTTDSCDPASGCVHSLNSGPCDDGDLCTYGDHCNLGECVAAGTVPCNDQNPCTTDSCDPDDGCVFAALNGADCDDQNACTAQSVCSGGVCLAVAMTKCNDDDVCTDDSCDPEVGCVHVANQAPCNDGLLCTVGDQCADGTCVGGELLACADDNPCTDDACVEGIGCQHTFNQAACDDGDACTGNDVCDQGTCGGTPLDCNDDDVCTDDSCNPASGCVHDHNTAPCDDNDACTTDDACTQGACQGGPALSCDDGESCTTDSCDPQSGCLYAPVVPCCGNGELEEGEECDDGNHLDGDACDSECLVAALQYLGFATWQQNCSVQSDVQQDAAMDQACQNKYGGRAATNPELIEGLIIGLPGSNSSNDHLILKCPKCAGASPYGAVDNHARACVNPGAGWPSQYYPDPAWNPNCCSSSRTTICVPK